MSGAAMAPDFDIKWVLGGGAGAVLTAIGLWIKASRARATTSDDGLHIKENASKGGWITDLENRLEAERQLRLAAEQRERETYQQHMVDLQRHASAQLQVSMLTEKVERLERVLRIVTEMLSVERPEMAAFFRSSGFGDLLSNLKEKNGG